MSAPDTSAMDTSSAMSQVQKLHGKTQKMHAAADSNLEAEAHVDLELLAGPTPFFYTSTVQRSNAVTHAVTGHFTSANELNLILAKTDRIEIYLVTPSGLKLLLEENIVGSIAALQCFTPKRAKWLRSRMTDPSVLEDPQAKRQVARLLEMGAGQDLLFLANDEFRFAVLAFDPAGSEVKTLSYGSWNTPPSADHVADGGMSVRIDPTSSCIVLHGHRGLLQLVRLTPEGIAEKQAFPLRFDGQQTVDVAFLPLEPAYPPVVLILAQDAFERRHLKSYTILGVDTRIPAEYSLRPSGGNGGSANYTPQVPAAAALMLSAAPRLVPGPWPHVLVDVSAHKLIPLPVSEPQIVTTGEGETKLELPVSRGGALVISVQNVAYFQATAATQQALDGAGAATLEAAARLVAHAHARPHTVTQKAEAGSLEISNHGDSMPSSAAPSPSFSPTGGSISELDAQNALCRWRSVGGLLSGRSWVDPSRLPLLSNRGLLADATSTLSLPPLSLSSLVKTFLPSPRGECTAAVVLRDLPNSSQKVTPVRVCLGLEHGLIYGIDVFVRSANSGKPGAQIMSSSSNSVKHIAELRFRRIGSVGSPEAIAQIDDHYFFVGSTKADSQLIFIPSLELPSILAMGANPPAGSTSSYASSLSVSASSSSSTTSAASSSSGSSASQAAPTGGLRVVEVYRNAGPVSDMLLIPPLRGGVLHVPAMVTCSGAYRQGVLGIFRVGTRLNFESSVLEVEGLQRIFGLHLPAVSTDDRTKHHYVGVMALGFAQETRVLSVQHDMMVEQDCIAFDDTTTKGESVLHTTSFNFPHTPSFTPALILTATASRLTLHSGEIRLSSATNDYSDSIESSLVVNIPVQTLAHEALMHVVNAASGAKSVSVALGRNTKTWDTQSLTRIGFTASDVASLAEPKALRITHVASNNRGQVLVAVSLPPAGIRMPRSGDAQAPAHSILILLQVSAPQSDMGALSLVRAITLLSEVSALDISPLGCSRLLTFSTGAGNEELTASFFCPVTEALPSVPSDLLPHPAPGEIETDPAYFAAVALWGAKSVVLVALPTLEVQFSLGATPFSSPSPRRDPTMANGNPTTLGAILSENDSATSALPSVASVFGTALSHHCRSLRFAALGPVTINTTELGSSTAVSTHGGIASWTNLMLACASDAGAVTTFGLELDLEALEQDFIKNLAAGGKANTCRPKLRISEPKHLYTGPAPVQFLVFTSCPTRNEAARASVAAALSISDDPNLPRRALESTHPTGVRRLRHLFVAGAHPHVISLLPAAATLTLSFSDATRSLRGRITKVRLAIERALSRSAGSSVPQPVPIKHEDSMTSEPTSEQGTDSVESTCAPSPTRPQHPPIRVIPVPDVTAHLAARLHSSAFPDSVIIGTATSVAIVSMTEERNPYDSGYAAPLVGLNTGIAPPLDGLLTTSQAEMLAADSERTGIFVSRLSAPTSAGLIYDAIPLGAEPRRLAFSADLDVLAVTVLEPAAVLSLGPAGALATAESTNGKNASQSEAGLGGTRRGVYDTLEVIPVAKCQPLDKPYGGLSSPGLGRYPDSSAAYSPSNEPRVYSAPPDTAELPSDGAGPSAMHPKLVLDRAGVRFFDARTFMEFARLQLLAHEEALSICELKLPFLEPGTTADLDKAAEIVDELQLSRQQYRAFGTHASASAGSGKGDVDSIRRQNDGSVSKGGLTLTPNGEVIPEVYAESVFLIGTGYIFNDEPEPTRGRILMVRADPVNRTLSLLSQRVIRGAVTSLKPFVGGSAFVAGVNSTVHIYRIRSSRVANAIQEMVTSAAHALQGQKPASADDSAHIDSISSFLGVDPLPYTIIPHCANTGHLYILNLRPYGTTISVASLNQSVSMLQYSPSTKTLNVVARDHVPRWVTAMETCSSQTVLVADDEGYLNAVVRASGFSPSVRADAEALFPAIAPYLTLLATRAGVFSDHRGWLRVVSRTMLTDTVNVIVQGTPFNTLSHNEPLLDVDVQYAPFEDGSHDQGVSATSVVSYAAHRKVISRLGAATATLAKALHAFIHQAASAVAVESPSSSRTYATAGSAAAPAASHLLSTALSPLDTAMLLRPPAPTHTLATRNGALISVAPLSRPQYVTMRALQSATQAAHAAEAALLRAARALARHLMKSQATIPSQDSMASTFQQKRIKTEDGAESKVAASQRILPPIPDQVLLLLPSCLRYQFYLGAERALASVYAAKLQSKEDDLSPLEERRRINAFTNTLLHNPIRICDDTSEPSSLDVPASVQIETVPLPEAEAFIHSQTSVGGLAVISSRMVPEMTDTAGGFIDGDLIVFGYRRLSYQGKLVVVRILAEWLRGDMAHIAAAAAAAAATTAVAGDAAAASATAAALAGLEAVNGGAISVCTPSPLTLQEAHELVALLSVYVDALAQTQGLV